MTISVGDKLPKATFLVMGKDGPVERGSEKIFAGRKVVLFGLPGAFTTPCHGAHMPSFVRSADALRAKGVEDILCVAVNDPFVLKHWGEATGATAKGISFLADPATTFIRAIGLEFSAAGAGLLNRSKRFSMLVEDGKVTRLNIEDAVGNCTVSAGEAMLEQV